MQCPNISNRISFFFHLVLYEINTKCKFAIDGRPIPFEDLLTILVSIFHLLHCARKGRETSYVKEEKGEGGY